MTKRDEDARLVWKHHSELVDGEVFALSLTGEAYVTAVPLFGSVAVYVDPDAERTDDSPTYRVDVLGNGYVWARRA